MPGAALPLLMRARMSYADYALALDFKNGTYRQGTSLTQAIAQLPGYSYARPGAKSELSSAGTLFPFAANVPGIVPGEGYWARAAVTNICVQSQALSNASWIKNGATVLADIAVAPDGSMAADKIVESALDELHMVSVNAGNMVAGQRRWGYIFLKAAERKWARVGFANSGTLESANCAWFNLADGTIGTVVSGEADIRACGDGWYRCGFLQPVTTAATTRYLQPQVALGDGSRTYQGDGTSGIYAWQGETVEATATVEPPLIASSTVTATAGPDALALAYSIADEDFIIWSSGYISMNANFEQLVAFNDGTTANEIGLYKRSGNDIRAYVVADGNIFLSNGIILAASGRCTILLRRSGGVYRAGIKTPDGAVTLMPSSAAFPMPPINQLQAGRATTTATLLNGKLENVFHRRGTFTDAEISAILAAA